MSGRADTPSQPLVKYGLTADEVAVDPIVRRHFAVAEEDAAVSRVVLDQSLANLAELRRTGRF